MNNYGLKSTSRPLTITVVMASYSGDDPEWLFLAGESVFTQTRKPEELIVVFDGPVGSAHRKAVKRLALIGKVVEIQLAENVGPGLARHRGILGASNEIIAIMDADDICRPDRFASQLSILRNGLSHVVGGWISEFHLFPGDMNELRKVPESHDAILAFARKRTPMNNVSAMFFKDAYLDTGGYGDMRANEDYDLYVRMLIKGYIFYNIQKVLVDVRGGSSMTSRRGGVFQVPDDAKMFFKMYQNGFISFLEALFNTGVRALARTLPNALRKALYQIFLRD